MLVRTGNVRPALIIRVFNVNNILIDQLGISG
jgi:hypothetical protein